MREDNKFIVHHYLDGELEGQTTITEHSNILDEEWKFPGNEVHFWWLNGKMFNFNPIEQEEINRERLYQEKISRTREQFNKLMVVKKLKLKLKNYTEMSVGNQIVSDQLQKIFEVIEELNGIKRD